MGFSHCMEMGEMLIHVVIHACELVLGSDITVRFSVYVCILTTFHPNRWKIFFFYLSVKLPSHSFFVEIFFTL